MEEEEWRPLNHIKGHGYEVSSLGRVRSLDRLEVRYKGQTRYVANCKGRILRPIAHPQGYFQICIRDKTRLLTHQAVALTFIPNPENYREINHKNGIKTDNRVENLEWCDRKHNNRHAADTGLMQSGIRHHASVLTADQVRAIRSSPKSKSAAVLSREFGASRTTVQRARSRASYKEID